MSVELEGFEELMQELTAAPAEIRQRGFEIVRDETEGAAAEIAQAYPVKTGTLAKRVQTFYPAESALVGIVRSSASHAHLYEFGTKERKTKSGASRGVMPAHKDRAAKITPVVAQRRRERMMRRLTDMLERIGFQVRDE